MKVVWEGEHPDEGSVHAWLDGELDADDAARLEAHVAACTSCAAMVAEARGLVAGASRVVGLLDDNPAPLVRPATTRAGSSPAWRFLRVTPSRYAIAALLLVAFGITLTRRQGAFDAVAPSTESAVSTVSGPSAAPEQDGLLDSAIKRRVAEDQPPRVVQAAPGADVAVPAPTSAFSAREMDSRSAQRVAAGRASLRAQADTMGAPADRARVGSVSGVAGGVAAAAPAARDIAAAVAAEGVMAKTTTNAAAAPMANRCVRIASSAPGASWGPEALPVVLVFDASGRNARVFTGAGVATDTRASLVRAADDSLTVQLRRIGYSGLLTVAGAGDARAGFMRSAQQVNQLGSVVVTSADEQRASRERQGARRADAPPVLASAPAPVSAGVPVTAAMVSCPTG